ncbi:NAD-dependent epimerase/dehydratase family protein [Patescibacteria group bacterium]
MNIAITGANGFLGSALENYYRDSDHNLLLLSKHSDKKRDVKGIDLNDLNKLTKVFATFKPNVVIHCAGLVNLTRDYQVGIECIRSNTSGTFTLLESLKDIKGVKIIYISTEEIYGSNLLPFTEKLSPDPPSPYAITKLAGENFCRLYSNLGAVELIILRVGTMYGPGIPENKYFSQIIKKALTGDDILMNSGMKKRDYVYVGDVVEAVDKCLKYKLTKFYEIINIGGGKEISLIDFVNTILSISGSKSKVVKGAIEERVNEADNWLMDITKAKQILNWSPNVDIDNGLKNTIKSLIDN